MTEQVQHKPSCFGISICYNPDSITCRSCRVRDLCRHEGKKETALMSEEMLVGDLMDRFKGPISIEQRKILDEMTNGAVAVTRFIFDQRLDLHKALLLKSIPIFHKFVWFETTCRYLIDGGFTMSTLTHYLARQHDWKLQTARTYAYTARAVLNGLDAIVYMRGVYLIRASGGIQRDNDWS